MYPQMETPGGTCTPKQKYEWACWDVTGLKIDYFQIRNSPDSPNRKYIEKNPNGFAYSNNDTIIQF